MKVSKEMFDKYPFLSTKKMDKREPYAMFGFECGEGWKSLLLTAFDKINVVIKDTSAIFKVLQIKEKFGGLRFYWSCSDCTEEQWDAIDKAVKEAENISTRTCEFCGKPGTLILRTGWWSVRCKDCRSK